MCTKPRIIVPGVFYQVYSKGVHGEDIFPTPELKDFFLKELAITLEKYSYLCCSWSLQKNHYHLVVKSSKEPISKFMQRLNSVYAKMFNRESGREGVVFFRRYASVITEETEIKKLIRYVHLNPVRCGECTLEELDHYEWCGHSAVVQGRDDDLLDKECLLNQFPGSEPLRQYRDYLSSEESDCGYNEIIGKVRNANRGKMGVSKPESWVIGSLDFIRMVLRKDHSRKVRLARHILTDTTLEKLHEALRCCLDCEKEELFHQGWKNQKSTSRELFAYLGTCCYDFRATEIAQYLGITGSGVSRMVSRYSGIIQREYLAESVCMYLPPVPSVP
ncbi:MAG: transposase [Chitinispirillaceae bacterium]